MNQTRSASAPSPTPGRRDGRRSARRAASRPPRHTRGPHLGEERRLFESYRQTRSPALREALVLRFLPMARHVARRYRHGSEPLEDLEQVASLGLLKAIDRFDPDRGMAFSSLAVPTIAGEIQRHFRDRTWSVRVPRSMHDAAVRVRRAEEQLQGKLDRATTVNDIAQHLGMDVEEVLDARAASFAHYAESLDRPRTTETADGESEIVHHSVEEPGFRAAEDTATLERLLECLDDRQRTILRLRFKEDLLQWEIATRVGCSQMHVSRLLRQAIATLQLAAEPASSDGSPSAHPQPARSPHG